MKTKSSFNAIHAHNLGNNLNLPLIVMAPTLRGSFGQRVHGVGGRNVLISKYRENSFFINIPASVTSMYSES